MMGKWFENENCSKKWKQGANARRIRCALGILLAATLVFNTLPVGGLAVSASEGSGGKLADASLSGPNCKGEDGEENKDKSEDTSICGHHREHTADCGYIPESEGAKGSPCTYECRICPIEELIAALPDAEDITEGNADGVRARLEEILALFSDLTEAEQELVDISPCLALQEKLDAASAASPLADEITLNSRITINSGNLNQYNNKVITGATTTNYLTISGVTASLTIKNLDLQIKPSLTDTDLHHAGIKLENNATLNLTLEGTNTIKGGTQFAAINVPAGCTLIINGSGSLTATGGDGGAGIGANWGGVTDSSIMTVGTIIINSGTINAYGLSGGAGIGGTMRGATGRVEIHGGTVYAEGSGYRDSMNGYHSAAGIGGGSVGKLESIRITGGSVTARGYWNPDGSILAASPGIGAGDSGYASEGNILDCGSITISGGTVNAKGGGDYAIGFGAAYGGSYQIRGSVEITEAAGIHLNGGQMNPMPSGYTMCTLAVTVYDKGITEDMSVSLACGGAEWSGTLKKSGGEPYCGSFTTGRLLVKGTASAPPTLTVTGGGKTWTKSVSPQANTSVTLGEKAYQYYTLKGTIHDINITENMTASVRAGEWTGTAELRKTVAYCGEFSVANLILPLEDERSETLVEITAGGNTWAGNASAGRDKTMTIGTLIEPAADTFDLAYGSVTFEEKDGALQVTYSTETEKDVTYGLSDASKVYEVIQSRPDTPTGGTQLRIINTTKPLRIRLTNVRMDNQTASRSPIDVMGSTVLELAGENILVSNSGVAALYVQSGKNLTLTGSGSLDARVNLPDGVEEDDQAGGAAIGGSNNSNSGMIVIESGRITATGSRGGAGIGGGHYGSGYVTINGGIVTARGGARSAGIGGGGFKSGNVTITGGIVTAWGGGVTGDTVPAGAGIGGGSGSGGSGNVTITGGTVTAFRGSDRSDGIGNGYFDNGGRVTITGGSVKADSVRNPQNSSGTKLACVRLQLKDAGSGVPVGAVSGLDGYGFHDVRTLDDGYIYAYLPSDVTPPTKITAGGVDYLPESENSTTYIADFQVTLTGYPLTKMYDGIAMANPTAAQVTCNVSEYSGLTFAWYQNNVKMDSAPVNAGGYVLRVSGDKGSKDFEVTITKRPLAVTALDQTIGYKEAISQDKYTINGLAPGDVPGSVALAAGQTAPGTYAGAIQVSPVQIVRGDENATENYNITYVPGNLTINRGVSAVSSWPAAGAITYGQALSDSTLTGGDANGTFAWKDGAAKPFAGTCSYEVVFTPADTNYGSVSGQVSVTVNQAPLTIRAGDQAIVYGGSIDDGTAKVTAAGLCGSDKLAGITLTASSVNVPGGVITPSAAVIQNDSGADVGSNYNITYETGKLTVSYMDFPAAILYNGEAEKAWYNRDVAITSDGYTISDAMGGDYKDSYTVSAQEGTVRKTLYFKDSSGHMSDGMEITVKFDRTAPVGEIAVGAKWWHNLLHFISFGNYAAKEYTVSINAKDAGGSGIDKAEYAIVTGTGQYTDGGALAEANLNWAEYNNGSKPAVPISSNPYVVYARLTDNAGNVTYISTDGILLDDTPPTVADLSVPEDTLKDVAAGFTFTLSEAADYYYVVLLQGSNPPSAEDIIATCSGTRAGDAAGTPIADAAAYGRGAFAADNPSDKISVEAGNLKPDTEYAVYVTAVDRAVDISDTADGTPAGNIGEVVQADFRTKKTLPVITKEPAISGIYGQAASEMAITGGAAEYAGTAVTGTWAVSSTDRDKKPFVGTTEKVTLIFMPENSSFDSVSVEAIPAVGRRSLGAPGVTVSEVAGTYTYDNGAEIKPAVTVSSGDPALGIFISDTGAVLTANDFTVSYGNNKEAGTASAVIAGKGNYTGSVIRTFTIGKAPGRIIPDLTGSYTDNGKTYIYTITPADGAIYRMGDSGKWSAPGERAGNVFEGITPGMRMTFYAKMPADKNHEEGTAKSITVDFPKLTPAALALTYKADRADRADIKITITPAGGAEYSFDGGQTWTDDSVKGGFTVSDTVILAIRLKETAAYNPSPAQTVTVNLAKKDRGAPPAFALQAMANGEADYTVTIPATEGCEYSFDGETWSDTNVKTGVNVGETVTGYKRYKETDAYNAGSAVSAVKTMEKFTVKTPVISPAGGSYEGSVSVSITCGLPGAEIYYTTDGSAPGRGSMRYTGAFTVTAPATVKAVAVKEGFQDSAVATVSYTKKNSGGSEGSGGAGEDSTSGGNGTSGGDSTSGGNSASGENGTSGGDSTSGGNSASGGNGTSGGNSASGGNSGGNEGNDGQGSTGSGSTDSGNGDTALQVPVTTPADTSAASGSGTTPANPGIQNTAVPVTGPGSGIGTPEQGTRRPFIKGEDGKIGWDAIRAEEEKAQEGSTINVDMNGSAVVPGDIFDSIKGKDITIAFDMGNGILWSVDGKSITADQAGDIDFSVKTGVNSVPMDIINNVTGERYNMQISLAYEGEFGFTAVLSINLGKENGGYTASLYYYNESAEKLEFICADEVAKDGTVSLAFTHASDYVIVIDGDADEENSNAAESAQPEEDGKAAGDGTVQAETPQAGQSWRPWRFVALGVLVLAAGTGVFFVIKKKKDGE